MTREEAKDVFLNRGFIEVEGCRGRIFHADKWREACIVISKWLEQEPTPDDCETCIHNKDVLECDMYGCKYEPTTKNCESCKYYGSHHEVCNYCYKCSLWTEQEPTTKDDKVDCKHTDCKNCVNHKYCDYESNCSEIPTGSTTKNDSLKYCDRNICLKNEYNNIGCENCEVTKSQKSTTKNDLGVSSGLKNVSPIIDWNNCHTSEQLDSIATPKNDLGVDCISRQAVLDLINADWKYEGLEIEINNLPPVTPIRPKGHWIVAKGNYLGMRNACCSNCKGFYTNDWNVMNYCPNCGAKMDEVEE